MDKNIKYEEAYSIARMFSMSLTRKALEDSKRYRVQVNGRLIGGECLFVRIDERFVKVIYLVGDSDGHGNGSNIEYFGDRFFDVGHLLQQNDCLLSLQRNSPQVKPHISPGHYHARLYYVESGIDQGLDYECLTFKCIPKPKPEVAKKGRRMKFTTFTEMNSYSSFRSMESIYEIPRQYRVVHDPIPPPPGDVVDTDDMPPPPEPPQWTYSTYDTPIPQYCENAEPMPDPDADIPT